MVTAINDDLFASDVIADPYTYFGQLRAEDPVHWNQKYELWVITRYDDLIWLTRHHELFSSEVFKRDPRGPYPAIDESDLDLYNTFVRPYQSARFIQHDRPEHLEERMVVHGYFTPKSAEQWRPLIQSAIKELLDEAEEKGRMEVMADFATPLPVLVIAQIMGIPFQDRLFIRELAKKSLFLNRGERDRIRTFAEGVQDMMGYVSPLLAVRLSQQPAFKDLVVQRVNPTDADLASDEALERWLMLNVGTSHHISGTCKMGLASDPMAVVDQYCRVHRLEGLRVADASVMPDVIRANTNATTIMIAERVADFIRRQ